jgi:hypothetical protein
LHASFVSESFSFLLDYQHRSTLKYFIKPSNLTGVRASAQMQEFMTVSIEDDADAPSLK